MIILIKFKVPSQEVKKCKKETIKYSNVRIAPKRKDEVGIGWNLHYYSELHYHKPRLAL